MTDQDDLDWRLRCALRERRSALAASCVTARLAHQRLANLYAARSALGRNPVELASSPALATDPIDVNGERHDRA